MAREIADCPFDYRLARTAYLVLPKLAIQAMPIEWRRRFEAMLAEMEEAGLETPSYIVLRDASYGDPDGCAVENEQTGFIRIIRKPDDPWANYRYGDAFALSRDTDRSGEAGQTNEDSAGPEGREPGPRSGIAQPIPGKSPHHPDRLRREGR